MSEAYRIIDVHNGSTSESWLVIYQDGRIEYHQENNGPRILRHGCEPVDELITMAEAEQLAQRHAKPQLLAQIREGSSN